MSNNKTVTMDYYKHEEMIEELKNLKSSKLCMLSVYVPAKYAWNNDKWVNVNINSNEQLKKEVEKTIDEHLEEIISPYLSQITGLQYENEQLKKQIDSLTKKSKWRFW